MLTLEQFTSDAVYASNVRNPPYRVIVADYELYKARVEARKAFTQLSVGDVVVSFDTDVRRVTAVYDDRVQLTKGKGWDSSFFIYEDGHCSFSGSLCFPIPYEAFHSTTAMKDAPAWFFSQDRSGAHRSITVNFPFRVWLCTEMPD